MLRHISIPARDPAAAAGAIAELIGGVAIPDIPLPGGYIALAANGAGVECLPLGKAICRSPSGAQFTEAPATGWTAFHAAFSTDLTEAQVRSVAASQNWPAQRRDLPGLFSVIEVWVDGHVMLEFLTPAMTSDYLALVKGAVQPVPELA